MGPVETLGLLVVGHFVADYPLQGEFLAKAKCRSCGIPGVPWYQALGAHAAIHGGAVGIVTGSVTVGIAEFLVHALIDDRKCAGRITFDQDQALHLGCKAAWVALIAAFGPIP